jgi:hypothetical protein
VCITSLLFALAISILRISSINAVFMFPYLIVLLVILLVNRLGKSCIPVLFLDFFEQII